MPFDLPEAEAELVAGYNVEYSSLGFALFFIAEYSSMLVMSVLAGVCWFGGFSGGSFWVALGVGVLLFVFVWTRGTLPRYRYDQFMRLGWKALLVLSLSGFVWFNSLSYVASY